MGPSPDSCMPCPSAFVSSTLHAWAHVPCFGLRAMSLLRVCPASLLCACACSCHHLCASCNPCFLRVAYGFCAHCCASARRGMSLPTRQQRRRDTRDALVPRAHVIIRVRPRQARCASCCYSIAHACMSAPAQKGQPEQSVLAREAQTMNHPLCVLFLCVLLCVHRRMRFLGYGTAWPEILRTRKHVAVSLPISLLPLLAPHATFF